MLRRREDAGARWDRQLAKGLRLSARPTEELPEPEPMLEETELLAIRKDTPEEARDLELHRFLFFGLRVGS